ncbi:hypothetical protein MJO28_001260 [Puccinia striiformis f. sp. tritici]|uniref:Glutathione S-transferase n=2 Tax=Puccinia striiformis f. sp. tritici TaxID=168172 RepID=A0A0L0URT8_9BASI|nr:hypothetical protein Pst134EA_003486 [Puccinia striiformis f. sp. tritici]XP_047812351.1 hypothetical protein Pst134EA_003496 [Puccinia striiformis f. sp. tritici]KNE89685.1 hypothetical protein PSTG_16848 [Puccinia striiformis f. sp. tritici PST-78]KAH9472887.1 hypothetical protein Pst134EA_003486 [Puccinia striiformis f. sp. tritici]KAH9472897.1 hypothetical protein Pst134EA_003496 [Puccinia striiformis f. sp. tritici]KAI7960771.1 hypothetical protein MJO28_001260 [Puccinia striiformis f.
MPSYKLTYFGIKGGRGDGIRMAFHYGGIQFTDERLSHAEFAKIKETLPFGQVPILTIDDKKVISQEVAILRYVGRLAGLYPDDPEEAVKVDVATCVVDDLYAVVPAFFAPENPGKEAAVKMVIEDRIPKMLQYIEKYLAKQGTTFSAGNSLTVADLRFYGILKLYQFGMLQGLSTSLLDPYPQIAKLYKAIESHEKIASWVKAESQ